MLIAENKVVLLDYTLKNAAGDVLDSSEGSEPLAYLHGANQIVPGLERALNGMTAGQSKDVVVPPEDAYGHSDPDGVFGVPRSAFPDNLPLETGQAFVGEDDEGNHVPVRVIEIRDDLIMVDANHPLAGQTLYFHVDVREVRDATAEELAHGHPHGPGDKHE